MVAFLILVIISFILYFKRKQILLLFNKEETPIKIMLIGFGGTENAFFLNSLLTVFCEKNILSLHENIVEESTEIKEIFNSIINKILSPRISNLKHVSLAIRERLKNDFNIKLSILAGRSVSAGGLVDHAGRTLKVVPEYNGFIVNIKSPSNKTEQEEASQQLAHCLQIISDVLANKQGIPVVLVLNKIYPLFEVEDIKNKSSISFFLCTEYNYKIIDQFFCFLKNDKHNIPNKVFFCTGSDFNSNEMTTNKLLLYGSGAAFLWTIYASLKTNNVKGEEKFIVGNEHILGRLLEGIQDFYFSDKAYFDDDHPHEIWHSQNISHLYSNQIW